MNLRILILLLSMLAAAVQADSKAVIDGGTQVALKRLAQHSPGAEWLLQRAAAVLVFPDIVKMGFGVGGQYGEGALLVDGLPVAYYATSGAPFGLELGVDYKAEVVVFMNRQVLQAFRRDHDWAVGTDGAVQLAPIEGGDINPRSIHEPMVGLIFSNQGLHHQLSMEGGRFTRIAR